MFAATQDDAEFEIIVSTGDHQATAAAILKESVSLDDFGMMDEEMEDMREYLSGAMDEFVDIALADEVKESGEADAEETALDGFVNDSEEEDEDDADDGRDGHDCGDDNDDYEGNDNGVDDDDGAR